MANSEPGGDAAAPLPAAAREETGIVAWRRLTPATQGAGERGWRRMPLRWCAGRPALRLAPGA